MSGLKARDISKENPDIKWSTKIEEIQQSFKFKKRDEKSWGKYMLSLEYPGGEAWKKKFNELKQLKEGVDDASWMVQME